MPITTCVNCGGRAYNIPHYHNPPLCMTCYRVTQLDAIDAVVKAALTDIESESEVTQEVIDAAIEDLRSWST